jgi:hypothetical protein
MLSLNLLKLEITSIIKQIVFKKSSELSFCPQGGDKITLKFKNTNFWVFSNLNCEKIA